MTDIADLIKWWGETFGAAWVRTRDVFAALQRTEDGQGWLRANLHTVGTESLGRWLRRHWWGGRRAYGGYSYFSLAKEPPAPRGWGEPGHVITVSASGPTACGKTTLIRRIQAALAAEYEFMRDGMTHDVLFVSWKSKRDHPQEPPMKPTDPLLDIKARWSALPAAPWASGGPVERSAVVGGPNQGSGLTDQVYEVAQEGDQIPPGICVVNKYFRPGIRDGEQDRRWSAEKLAAGIAAAPSDIAWLIAEVERLRRGC